MNRPVTFLIGVGIGAGLALLFAPQTGEELRGRISDFADDSLTALRRKSQRSIRQLQKMVSRGGDSVNRAVDTSRHALDSIADRLA